MKNAIIAAHLLKCAILVQENRTSFLISTDNEEIGREGTIIVDSNVFYNAAVTSGVISADLLLKAVKAADPEERSEVYREHENLVVGEVNGSFIGGVITFNVVRYEAGDKIPLSKKDFQRIAENGFLNQKGEVIRAVEEAGRYFIVASKDWDSVTVRDFTLQKSDRALLIAEMAKTASIRDLFAIKTSASALSIFKKKGAIKEEPVSGGIREEDINDPFADAEAEALESAEHKAELARIAKAEKAAAKAAASK